MTLRLHDTATRSVREFRPLRPGEASIYVCGATVQSSPHIGHVRSGVVFDILRRWLRHKGLNVTLIRNVTDIDDKILRKSSDAGVPWWEWAMRYEREFDRAYSLLGVEPPTYEPRATGHIPEMIELMKVLIDTGHAYVVGGDVYFDVRSWPDYGALSGQRPADSTEAIEPGAGKRYPADFALWKSAKPDEPYWPTPWGPGRPGWHLECSVMATKYCGTRFDIHGGGIDLIFPHHENEMAQSRAAGDGFARYWMHNAWVTTAGEKMAKSLGNSLLVEELTRRVRPVELRYYLGSAHYRSMLEFSPESLDEAAVGYRRIESFVRRATERVGDVDPRTAVLCADFDQAMDDDLGVPAALAALHNAVTEGNGALSRPGADPAIRGALTSVRAMAELLGIDPLSPTWSRGADPRTAVALSVLVEHLLEQRQLARSARDFATADAIRQTLRQGGIGVEDGSAGSRWSLED